MKIKVLDEDLDIVGARITKDGYLVASVLCARTGIQVYAGSELGLDSMPTVRVYRPEENVFDKKSLATYVGKPVTDNHPVEQVNSENWKIYAKGSIGEGVLREGEYIRVPITLMDGNLVQKVVDGKRELSMGYTMDIELKQGMTANDEEYDAIAHNFEMNHMAVVDKGRAGTKARIGDNWGECLTTLKTEENDMKTVTITVDGMPVETTEQGAAAVNKLNAQVDQLTNDAKQAETDHTKALDDKDKELAVKDKEISDLKEAQISDEKLDAMIEERIEVLTKANALVKDADFKGKTIPEIKKLVVEKIRGEDSVKDKGEVYIDATFDLIDIEDDESKDKVRKNIHKIKSRDKDDEDDLNAQGKYETNITDAWKTQANK